jgi:NTP pyrophosphatase (non-canonical NTP hydrolase)
MTMNDYQKEALKTAIFKEKDNITYPVLGITGEAGEVAEKVKKILRDQDGVMTKKNKEELAFELGDVLWYIAIFSHVLGYSLKEVARMNIDKLKNRKARGTIHGSGDNR